MRHDEDMSGYWRITDRVDALPSRVRSRISDHIGTNLDQETTCAIAFIDQAADPGDAFVVVASDGAVVRQRSGRMRSFRFDSLAWLDRTDAGDIVFRTADGDAELFNETAIPPRKVTDTLHRVIESAWYAQGEEQAEEEEPSRIDEPIEDGGSGFQPVILPLPANVPTSQGGKPALPPWADAWHSSPFIIRALLVIVPLGLGYMVLGGSGGPSRTIEEGTPVQRTAQASTAAPATPARPKLIPFTVAKSEDESTATKAMFSRRLVVDPKATKAQVNDLLVWHYHDLWKELRRADQANKLIFISVYPSKRRAMAGVGEWRGMISSGAGSGRLTEWPEPSFKGAEPDEKVPSKRDQRIYDALWKEFSSHPGTPEKKVFRRVARRFKISVKKAESIYDEVWLHRNKSGK